MKKRAVSTAGPAPQYPIESVDNALLVLLLLGESEELRLTDVAEYLGIASSSAHRLMAMLLYRGFVRQDPRSKLYRPGTALTGVAFSILQRFDARQTLRPCLDRVHAETGELVHLGILDGSMVRFIDAIDSSKAVRVASRLGFVMPANCTSTGKAMLAQLSVEELHELFPEERLEALTPNSISSRTDLELELATIRRRGYATSNEESEESVSSVAMALPAGLLPVRHAINVALPATRLNREEIKRITKILSKAIEETAPLPH